MIAVASTDGEMVNEHFGRAARFWVFEVAEAKQTLVMVRNVVPLSTGDRNHPFDPDRMEAITDTIRGCERLYCAQIGDRPRQELKKKGIEAIVYNDAISSIVI